MFDHGVGGDRLLFDLPAIVVGDHREGGERNLGFSGQLCLGKIGHSDEVETKFPIGFGFGPGRESRAIHIHIRPPVVDVFPEVSGGREEELTQGLGDGIAECDVRHDPSAEEGMMGPLARSIEELVEENDVARTVLLLQGTHCSDGDDPAYVERSQGPDVGPVIQLRGEMHMTTPVPGEKVNLSPSHATPDDRVGRRPEGRLDRDFFHVAETVDVIETGSTDHSDCGFVLWGMHASIVRASLSKPSGDCRHDGVSVRPDLADSRSFCFLYILKILTIFFKMLFRLSLSLVLIGTGIASPWLVQDWLETHPSDRGVESLVEKAIEAPRRWSRWILPDRESEESVVEASGELESGVATISEPVVKTGEGTEKADSTGLTRRPYPLASSTSRVLRGLLPGGAGEYGRFGSTAAVETSFSKSVVKETGAQLDAELGRMGLRRGADLFVRIFKEEKELEVWLQGSEESRFELFKVYRLRDLAGKLGPKLREGDKQSPEGFYYVSSERMRPGTRHHLGMDLGYPNELDRSLGRTGGEIMIHGGTRSGGSYVLSPEDMNEVFTLASSSLRNEQRFFRVHVFPFRMTDQRMEQEWARQPKWIDFWVNLKEGYDFFENAQFPPSVQTEEKEYLFRFP